MARFSSPVYSVIRGSVAGLTYTANQFHQLIVRHRTSPVQPNTLAQFRMRQGLVTAEDIWKDLEDYQRDDWNNFAASVTFQGPLGPYTVPGRQLVNGWIGLREAMVTWGYAFTAPVNTAPTLPGRITPLTFRALTTPASGVGFKVDLKNLNDVPVWGVTQIAGPFNESRRHFKGPFRHWDHTSDTYNEFDAGETDEIIYDNLIADAYYFLRWFSITNGDVCNVSQESIMRIQALAAP